MKGDFGKTVQAHGHNRRSNANRGVTRHRTVFPWAGGHSSRQNRIQGKRNGTWQAYLSSVCMSAQHHLKACLSGLPIDLRRMREQNGDLAMRDSRGGLLDIVRSVVVGVVNSSQMDMLVATDNRFAFIEQHSNPHRFDFREHSDRVLIAEYSINRSMELIAHCCQAIKSSFERTKCLAPEVACHGADVVPEVGENL